MPRSQEFFSLKEPNDIGSGSRHKGRHSHGPTRLIRVKKGCQRHVFHPKKGFLGGMDLWKISLFPFVMPCCSEL